MKTKVEASGKATKKENGTQTLNYIYVLREENGRENGMRVCVRVLFVVLYENPNIIDSQNDVGKKMDDMRI